PRRALVRTFLEQDHLNCLNQDNQIKQQALILDVVQIVAQLFLTILFAIRIGKTELRPPGNTRFHSMTLIIKRDFFSQLPHEHGAFRTRAYKSHVALEHIEDLRQLIDTDFSDKGSNPSDPRVIFLRPDRLPALFRINTHTAKLDDIKALAVQP